MPMRFFRCSQSSTRISAIVPSVDAGLDEMPARTAKGIVAAPATAVPSMHDSVSSGEIGPRPGCMWPSTSTSTPRWDAFPCRCVGLSGPSPPARLPGPRPAVAGWGG